MLSCMNWTSSVAFSGSSMRLASATASLVAALVLAAGGSAHGTDAAGDALIHVDAAPAAGFTGAGVTLALLDTGVDPRDAAVATRVVAEHCFVPPDGCPGGQAEADGPGSAHDDQGHGTAVADIVAETAPGVTLVVVKVADANGRTTSGQVIAGLDWLRTHHPEARIVNVSLAGDIPLSGNCSHLTDSLEAYAASVDALHTAGTSVFAAAGNDGRTNGVPAPACFPSAVAVGAIYAHAGGSFLAPDVCVDHVTRVDQVACFSNTSSELDLLAVGVTATLTGTSAASAQAAGAAALVLQADPSLDPDALVELLRETGVPVADPRAHVLQPLVPRVDVAAALTRALGRPIPLLPAPPSAPAATAPVSAPTVPVISVSTARISFTGRTRRRTIIVRNVGSGTLTIRATATGAFVVSPARARVKTSAHLTIAFRPLGPGGYRGMLRLSTDDPAHPRVAVGLTGRG